MGLSGQNLVSRDIDTKDIYITNGMTGETTNYKDTYQIRPLVTAGVAWHNDLLTVSADGDLTETKGFKSEDNSQYVASALKFDRYHGWRCAQGIVRM